MLITKKLVIAIAAGLAVLVPVVVLAAGTALADTPCSSAIVENVNDNIEVNGACTIDATINGDVKLDAPGDSVNFNSGSLDGNIEAIDSLLVKVGSGTEINVGLGTEMNGNVKAENTADTIIGAAKVRGNIEVKDGNLQVLPGAEIFGDVIHEGSGACVVAPEAVVHGNIEGCPTP